jgi:hypothetical protein
MERLVAILEYLRAHDPAGYRAALVILRRLAKKT